VLLGLLCCVILDNHNIVAGSGFSYNTGSHSTVIVIIPEIQNVRIVCTFVALLWLLLFLYSLFSIKQLPLQCFIDVGWASGRASSL